MTGIFLHLVNMSITAGWIVLAVAVLRLLLRKAPRWMLCLLWGLVGIRLLLPISIESVISLIPSKETIPPEIIYSPAPQIHSGINTFNNAVNPIISESFAPEAGASVNPLQVILGIASYVWLAGIAAMLLYTLISFLRLKSKVRISIPTQKDVYICDNINTPFILGIIKPKIYLPSTLSAEDTAYVLAHEKAHIKRKDYLWKPLGFLLLTVYWFNPLLWVGYILLCRDIELACDEKVLASEQSISKKEYSTALLHCSVPRHMIAACPLAFGEVGVKQRIKNILNYKKPAFWIICVALVLSIIASVCLLTNPVTKDEDNFGAEVLSTGSEIEGVSLEIVDLNLEETSTSVPYIEIKWKNENNESYTCGEPFFMYKKVDGEWVNIRHGNSVFTMIGYTIPKHGDFTHKYSLWDIEIDEPGEYRFTSHFLRDKGDTTPTQYKTWIEFEVKEIPSPKDYSFAVVKQGSDRYGVSLDVVRVSTKGDDPFIEIRWNNDTDYDFTATNEYKIYKHEIADNWELLNEGNYEWEDIAHVVPAKDSFTKKFSLKNFDIGSLTNNGKYRFECPFSSAGETAWVEFYYPLTKSTVASSYVNSDLAGLSVEVVDMSQTLKEGTEYLNDDSKIKIKWTNRSRFDLTTTGHKFVELHKNVNGGWVDMTLVKQRIFSSDSDFAAVQAMELDRNKSLVISHSLFGKRFLEDGEYKLTVNFVTESGTMYAANVYFCVGKSTTTTTVTSGEDDCIVYYCNDAQDTISGARPELRLYPTGNRFELTLSSLSSYLPTGTYRYEDSKLILEAEYGNKYVFSINQGSMEHELTDIDGNEYTLMTSSFSFIEGESTQLPKFKYNDNDVAKYPFEDGAIFELDDEAIGTGAHTGYIYDATSYDIDADGVKEELTLTFGPTYGRETVSLVVKEGGRQQSITTFENYYDATIFEEKDGKLYLTSGYGLSYSEGLTEPTYIEIAYDNGIVLKKDGFPFGYDMEYPTEEAAHAINAYIEGFKTHDVELINSVLHEDLRFDSEDTKLLINPVEDCKLITADMENFNGKEVLVNLTYEITFSEDYKPVGMREKGVNRISNIFTIEAIEDEFLITDIGVEVVEKLN